MKIVPKIKVLHICSYFILSKVHRNLLIHLDEKIRQYIYVPVRQKKGIGSNRFQFKNSSLTYNKIWSWYHRILYHWKINKAYKYLNNFNLNFEYNIIHAHTWFSDGGVAWLLNKRNKTPYVITIRNTDINIFYKKLFYLKRTGHSILKNASKIVFISPAYFDKLLDLIPEKLRNEVTRKSVIYPNGIDDFWFERKKDYAQMPISNGKFNLLYVGEISRNKNILRIINAFRKLNYLSVDATLTLVGFKNHGFYEKYLKRKFANLKGLSIIDRVTDKQELLRYYQKADLFIMPSLTETFGLVYIEALSQGLPIIYSKGQGVDGYFEMDQVGVPVNPKSIKEITLAILEIYQNYLNFNKLSQLDLDQFRWTNISDKYTHLYAGVISNAN